MARTKPKLATIRDFATQEYKAWAPGGAPSLTDPAKWRDRAHHDFALIQLALAVMERDHVGNAAVAAEAPPELLAEFTKGLHEATIRHRQLATLLLAAHTRVVGGMARVAVERGES